MLMKRKKQHKITGFTFSSCATVLPFKCVFPRPNCKPTPGSVNQRGQRPENSWCWPLTHNTHMESNLLLISQFPVSPNPTPLTKNHRHPPPPSNCPRNKKKPSLFLHMFSFLPHSLRLLAEPTYLYIFPLCLCSVASHTSRIALQSPLKASFDAQRDGIVEWDAMHSS